MNFRILTLALATLLAGAQSVTRSRIADGFDAIRISDLRADLTFLASDALEGRLSLARGSEVAIEWIAAEFTRAGLKPILQKVPLIEYHADRQQSHLAIETNGNRELFHFPDAYGNFPNDVTVAGPV